MSQDTLAPRYVNEQEVSKLTGIALSTLRQDRFKRRRLPYYRFGSKVLYRLDEVLRYMEEYCRVKVDAI